MDWARDGLGNLVHSSQPGIVAYWLRCPTCGEPVRRRAGAQRRPHFAHFSFLAKPECEYYHPSPGLSTHFVGRNRIGQRPVAKGAAPHVAILLELRTGVEYSLYLQLPPLTNVGNSVGEIVIRSGLGTRKYSVAHLQKRRQVPVTPTIPLVAISASGAVAHMASEIEVRIAQFRSVGNYFHAGERGAVLIPAEEPLRWGERYVLLTNQRVTEVPGCAATVVYRGRESLGWHLHEIELPDFVSAGNEHSMAATSLLLGRRIERPHSRVYVVLPPPHHFDVDGTYVFAAPIARILLRRTDGGSVRVTADSVDMSEPIIRQIAEEWFEITNLSTRDFAVLLEERPELFGRIEECDLYRPEGVQVAVGERCWEIFEPDAVDAIRAGAHETIRIECPSDLVAEQFSKENESLIRDGTTFTPRNSTSLFIVDAGNFGRVLWPSARLESGEHTPTRSRAAATRTWLEGIVARHYGPDIVNQLRAHWSNPNRFPPVIVDKFPWLIPHIQLGRLG